MLLTPQLPPTIARQTLLPCFQYLPLVEILANGQPPLLMIQLSILGFCHYSYSHCRPICFLVGLPCWELFNNCFLVLLPSILKECRSCVSATVVILPPFCSSTLWSPQPTCKIGSLLRGRFRSQRDALFSKKEKKMGQRKQTRLLRHCNQHFRWSLQTKCPFFSYFLKLKSLYWFVGFIFT